MAYLGDIREDNPEKEIGIIWGNINAVSKRYKWNGAYMTLNGMEPEDTRLYSYVRDYNDRSREKNIISVSPLADDNTITLTAQKAVTSPVMAIVKYQYINKYGNLDTNTITIEFEVGEDVVSSTPLFDEGSSFEIINVLFTPEKDDKFEYVAGESYIVDYSSLYYGVIRSADINIISADMITASTYNFEIIKDMKPGLNPLVFGLSIDPIEGLNEMDDDEVNALKQELSQTFVVVYDTDFKSISMTDALGMEDNTWEKLPSSFKIGENSYNVFIHRDRGDQVDIRDKAQCGEDPNENRVYFSYNAKLT